MDISGKINVLKEDSLLIIPEFLSKKFSSQLRQEIAKSKQYLTPLIDVEKRIERKEKLEGRPNAVFDISADLQERLENKISDIKPAVEDFFSIKLSEPKKPYYAIYQTGDFVERHADAHPNVKNTNEIKSTRIVIIILLNDNIGEATDENASNFTGGHLTFYGVIKDKAFKEYGYPLKAKAGTLIAFPATCLHEVTKVTSGVRYVVNTGFY